MDFTTLYEITTAEPQCFNQVWQDLFHCHDDLLRFHSYANSVAFILIGYSLLCSCVTLGIWAGVARLRGGPAMTISTQLIGLAVLPPIFLVLLLFGMLTFVTYPNHAKLAQAYARGEYTKLEGVIKNAQTAQGGRSLVQKTIFMLHGQTVVIYSDHPGFDNPAHPSIGNGQRVRICMIDGKGNPPTILRFDVLKPYLKNCDRATVNW